MPHKYTEARETVSSCNFLLTPRAERQIMLKQNWSVTSKSKRATIELSHLILINREKIDFFF